MPKKDEKGLIVPAVKEESSQETKKDEPYKISWFDKIPFWFKAISSSTGMSESSTSSSIWVCRI